MARSGNPIGGRRDIRLTEEVIQAAALRIIDAEGVEALSMRKLAAALGVNPMSLYHHVPNKAALLAGVTRRTAAVVRRPVDGPWQEQLRALAEDYRALAALHPGLMRYAFTSADFARHESVFWQALCRILGEAGFRPEQVEPVAAVLAGLVGGLLHAEANGALAAHDADACFATAVAILVAGVAAQLER
jgi:AcrR family transcriptional regulator